MTRKQAAKDKGKGVAKEKGVVIRDPDEAEFDPAYDGKKGLKKDELVLYNKLEKRVMHSTRFINVDCLKSLGIDEMMLTILDKAGLRNLAQLRAPTRKQWVLEFLATLSLEKETPISERRIKFRLNQTRHTMTFKKLRQAMGISKDPNGLNHLKARSLCKPIWRDLTHFEDFPAQAKSSMIPHPVVRILHRFIATVFLGQGEPTKVSKEGVSLLSSCLEQSGGVPDWAQIFVDSCLALQKSKSGKIALGGMVTLIAAGVGVKNALGVSIISPHYTYDRAALVQFKCITPLGKDAAIWKFGAGEVSYLVLPRSKGQIPLSSGPNAKDWYMPPDPEYTRVVQKYLEQSAKGEEAREGEEESDDDDDELEVDSGDGREVEGHVQEEVRASKRPRVEPVVASSSEAESGLMAQIKELIVGVHKSVEELKGRQQQLEDIVHLNNNLLLAQHRFLKKTYPDYQGPSDDELSTFYEHHGTYNVNARFKSGKEGAGSSKGGI